MERAIQDLVEQFAARAATPAGGAAAVLSLALGAAVGLKVVRFTLTPGLESEGRAVLTAAERELLRVVGEGLPKFEEDCRAVRGLLAYAKAARKPRGTAIERDLDRTALQEAMQVPLESLSLARDGIGAVEGVMGMIKPVLISDAAAAASLMWSAAEISHWNLWNNAGWLTKPRQWAELLERADAIKVAARDSYEAVRAGAIERLGITK
ncbi:MAG: cyclodeaminase/cyclohydrolase family protein [Vicinamibacteria bacterium]